MELSVKELCDRYNLSDRSTLYNVRLKGLKKLGYNTSFKKRNNKSYADEKLINLLDQLNNYIKDNAGSPISSFVPTAIAEVTVHNSTAQHSEIIDLPIVSSNKQHSAQLTAQHRTQEELLGDIVAAIAEKMQPKNPLWYMHELEIAIANKWQLSTSQIEEMIGTKPRGETFSHGCFIFSKSGKIGRESAWKVTKEIDND